jgi:hypothetical protein
MVALNLHSMSEFSPLIGQLLDAVSARSTIEIGVEHGPMSAYLAKRAVGNGGQHHGIDPSPAQAANSYFDGVSAILHQGTSLEVLPTLPLADAYFIDGDHNYYTVKHELELICRAHGERPSTQTARPFPLLLLHDTGWPCGRRDFYYNPATIPADSLHPHSFDKGVHPRLKTVVDGGLRGEGAFAVALHQGGPKNGVLTAIEDVLAAQPDLCLAQIPCIYGFGIVTSRTVAQTIAPLLPTPETLDLLARMERNRLDLYIRVIELQDREIAQRQRMLGAL